MTPEQRRPIASLWVMQFGSNTGYALSALETLFFEEGLDLASGDPGKVHFAYPEFSKGHPRILPEAFGNLLEFDFRAPTEEATRRLVEYVRRNAIELVLVFDIQPVHRIFAPLRRAGVRTILTYWGAPMSSRAPLWKLLLKRAEVALSRSRLDGLIFESRAMADLAVYGRGVPWRMIDIVPLGVDIEAYRPSAPGYVQQALGLPPDRKVVVYAGHIDPRKGVHTLVEAAIELIVNRGRRDMTVLLCGNKPGESEPYEAMYAGKGVGDRIIFGGYRSDLPRMYPTCLCGVIPSSGWDSFPRTAVEMAACGIPVVASRLQGLPEAVHDGKTGLLFDTGDAHGLANRIETLLDQPELARALGEAGRRRCEEELNLRVQFERFRAAIRKRMPAGD